MTMSYDELFKLLLHGRFSEIVALGPNKVLSAFMLSFNFSDPTKDPPFISFFREVGRREDWQRVLIPHLMALYDQGQLYGSDRCCKVFSAIGSISFSWFLRGLDHPNQMIQLNSIKLIGEFPQIANGNPWLLRKLVGIAEHNPDIKFRLAALTSLDNICRGFQQPLAKEFKEITPVLIRLLEDPEAAVQEWPILTLERLKDVRAIEPIRKLFLLEIEKAPFMVVSGQTESERLPTAPAAHALFVLEDQLSISLYRLLVKGDLDYAVSLGPVELKRLFNKYIQLMERFYLEGDLVKGKKKCSDLYYAMMQTLNWQKSIVELGEMASKDIRTPRGVFRTQRAQGRVYA